MPGCASYGHMPACHTHVSFVIMDVKLPSRIESTVRSKLRHLGPPAPAFVKAAVYTHICPLDVMTVSGSHY